MKIKTNTRKPVNLWLKGPVQQWKFNAVLEDDPTTVKEYAVEMWDSLGEDKTIPCINSANRLRALSDWLLKAADFLESKGQK